MSLSETRLSPWLCCFEPLQRPRLRLFCFPHAGGGASAYRLWPKLLQDGVELWAIQPPGREARMLEPSISSRAEMIDGLTNALRGHLDLPFAFFGHSMGAVIAFELARRLRQEGMPLPEHLFVSGRGAPHLIKAEGAIHTLPDAEFVEHLQRRYGAIDPIILQEAEMMRLIVGVLRADLSMVTTYRCEPELPLPVPITAFAGTEDAAAALDDVAAWAQHSAIRFRLEPQPGRHFFVQSRREQVVAIVSRELAALSEPR